MRAAWQNQNLRRMGKYEPPPLKMLIRAFLRGNDLKAFLFHQSAFSAFPRLCHLKPTTATTTWNSKQKHHSAIFCFFRRYFRIKEGSVFRFICQWDSYNLFALFFMTLPKTASDGSKSGSNGCFYCFSDCRKACFSLSMQSIDPIKLRIFFGFSSLFPQFFEVKGRERCILDLLMMVKM